jgi:predicted nucleic acid-binding protein
VPVVYFDSSALVKLVVDEDGSELAAALWDGCDAAVSSRLAYPEVRAALAAAARDHRIGTRARRAAEDDWEDFWAATQPVELTETVERHAGLVATTYALGGADAVHLASALAILPTNMIVAVWDRRLRDGARAAGLPVAPA